jgi:sialic acid synthase SpsE
MATDGRGVTENEVSLSTITYLRDRYEVPVGFIDHTSSSIVPALAVAHGAVVVSKHLAPEKGWRGPDWQVCLTPDEMAVCLCYTRLADAAKGSAQKHFASGEEEDRSIMRRSIVAAKDMPAGHALMKEDLLLKRPGTGIDARQLESVIGKTLCGPVNEDDIILSDQIK